MFELKIDTSNAAFDHPYEEVARILRSAADQVEEAFTSGRAFDYNGNEVGSWELAFHCRDCGAHIAAAHESECPLAPDDED